MKGESEAVETREKIALGIVKEAIQNIWSSYAEGCEYEEDQLPKEFKDSITKVHLERAKRVFEQKGVGEYHSESRYFLSICSNFANHVTDCVWESIEDYFNRA